MPYIEKQDRDQLMMCSLSSFVDEQSTARLIDVFVDSLNLEVMGFTKVKPSFEGRPCYDPQSLLKLYLYGYKNDIRSSRKLANACKTNLEIRWMISGLEPDFRTISDFRKSNAAQLKKVFNEFTLRLSGVVEWGFSSVDGSKILANNSKDRNFTKNKLDDRIKWLRGHIDEYFRQLDDIDLSEDEEDASMLTKEEVERKLQDAQERLNRYLGYQRIMEDEGITQLSLTDADAKLMKNKNGFAVAYNPQTAVDSNTHIIRDFKMTNQPTDHGLIYDAMENIKEQHPDEIIDVVADKGYVSTEDMAECLEHGIVPNVVLDDGKDEYGIEMAYVEKETDSTATDPQSLSDCLHAGVIPEAYKDCIHDMEVVEKRRFVKEETKEVKVESMYGTTKDMIAKAKEGYFVRDPEANVVYCPRGEMLRQKCVKKNGNIRYANKNACRHCPHRNRCYKGKNEWKEIDFTKDTLVKPCRDWLLSIGSRVPNDIKVKGTASKGHFETVKIVRFKLKPNRNKMEQRKCLSEHPFGTIKRTMGAGYFLLRGMEKVTGEFALLCTGYNIERAKNLLGFDKLMEVMATT